MVDPTMFNNIINEPHKGKLQKQNKQWVQFHSTK